MKKISYALVVFVLTLFVGCGEDDSLFSSGGGENTLTFSGEKPSEMFEMKLVSNNIGVDFDSPYMVSYGIIEESSINPESYDEQTGIKNTGYESAVFQKNSGDQGEGSTRCEQSSLSEYDYVRYTCLTHLTNGTELSNELVLLMGKTYVVFLQESFMRSDGIGFTFDEKIKEVAKFTL